MAKLRTEKIKGQSAEDVQRKLEQWLKQTAGRVVISKIHRVERIEEPQGYLKLPGPWKLRGIDTLVVRVDYTDKPQR
jgi:hypothetical protein